MATCPLCDEPLSIQPGAKILGQTAECYEDCWEVCLRCRIGLSNAKDPSRTFIRQDWKDGLWRRSTAGRLEEMIAGSLNEQSRKKKKGRLANERSEDLLTWNVFSWLEDRDLLGHLMAMFGGDASSSVQIFYWGANDRYPLPLDLKAILVGRFKESAQFLSEPDVILINAQRVVLIEAKLGSGNISVPGDVRVDKYVNAMPAWFAPVVSVRQAGFYELTRNWAIGAALATALGRQFSLVNLVREVDEHDIATSFGGVLAPLGQFQRHTWEQLATRSWCHASNGRPFTSSQRLPQSLMRGLWSRMHIRPVSTTSLSHSYSASGRRTFLAMPTGRTSSTGLTSRWDFSGVSIKR